MTSLRLCGMVVCCIVMFGMGCGCVNAVSSAEQSIHVEETVTIESEGGGAEISFQGVSGKRIRITLEADEKSMEPYGYLQAPDGSGEDMPSMETVHGGKNSVDFTLKQSGDYILTVFDGSNQGGTVSVKIESIAGSSTPSPTSVTSPEATLPINASAIIIDHTCTDINKIPDQWLEKARQLIRIHYAHTSHGEQITVGLERLAEENPRYAFSRGECQLPEDPGVLNMLDGQSADDYCETYVTPDLYWEGEHALEITRSVLSQFPVNISAWAWCTQLDSYSQSEVEHYFTQMSKLEEEFPHVRFIYFTGNAQSSEPNRGERNRQIRDFCSRNGKILFDFGNLDCWYRGEQYQEQGLLMENPHYHGDEAGHTTFESCENKACAFWWLMARLAGWNGRR